MVKKMESSRFEKQIRFIKEIDKLKRISRQTILMDGSRQENSAEHSWHVAIMAIVLSEYAQNAAIDWLRVLKMLLIHDLVEIDAGDTFCYSAQKCEDKELREQKAADRIFNLLPKDQGEEFRTLWNEFEAQTSSESLFAAALDRLQPVLHNYHNNGKTWQKNHVISRQVLARNEITKHEAPFLWEYTINLIEEAVSRGMLSR